VSGVDLWCLLYGRLLGVMVLEEDVRGWWLGREKNDEASFWG
jgi:hypothetical protein